MLTCWLSGRMRAVWSPGGPQEPDHLKSSGVGASESFQGPRIAWLSTGCVAVVGRVPLPRPVHISKQGKAWGYVPVRTDSLLIAAYRVAHVGCIGFETLTVVRGPHACRTAGYPGIDGRLI